MIELRNVSKTYVMRGRRKVIANDISAVFPTGVSVALLGRNGTGKSSLLRMIAGTQDVDSGSIVSDGSISWPVGFAGSFHPELTGAQNVLFLARVYGADTQMMCDEVERFAELGTHFHLPVRTYSSGMRSRLAFGASMAIDFDTYLVDEVTSVGDAAFKEKSQAVFLERMEHRSSIVVSHAMGFIRSTCQHGAVLERGRLHYYEDIELAIRHHNGIMRKAAG